MDPIPPAPAFAQLEEAMASMPPVSAIEQRAVPMDSMLPVPTVEQCEASNGMIVRAGLLAIPACQILTKDGGKSCRNSSECVGRCLVEEWEGDYPPSIGVQSEGHCE